jgi:dolichol-phosphate mannosyltransferase
MISVLVPCYNEVAVLPQLYQRLTAAATTWGETYEVVLIDDGSQDETWEAVKLFHQRDPRWKGIRLARNFGHQAALGAGIHHARGHAAVILDADLQDPPEIVAEFLQQWRQGAHIVYGVRTQRPESWWKRACYHLYYRLLARHADVALPPDAGDFCLLDRRVLRVLRTFREATPYWRGLRAWCGFQQVGVPYARHSRQAGISQYSWKKLFRLAGDGLWSMTDLPLRWLSQILLVIFLCVLVCGFLAWREPTSSVVGLAICGLAGMQLLTALFFGQYQRRLLAEMRRRPRFVVSACVGFRKVRSLPGLTVVRSVPA